MRQAVKTGGFTIAVVEDDESILDAIKLVLENQRWDVAGYTSGEDFLVDLAGEFYPDLLLLDPHLPGMNGMEVVERIPDALITLPIIVLTARPNSYLNSLLEQAGVNEILVKPVTEETLLDRVRVALTTPNIH